jgi:predicted nucleic acid-binding protein
MCALLRKSGAPAGGDAFRRFVSDCDAARVLLLPCAGPVFGEAQKVVEAAYGRSRPVMLRSLDAIHLASAITIGATTVVATDSRLRDSAKLLGLRVIPEEVGAARVTP